GEELGLLDAFIPPERAVDPGGRDGCRAPLPWDGTDDHGWSMAAGADPWLPFPDESANRNYAAQRADPKSILHLYQRLIALRRQHPALALGDFQPLEAPDGVLAYRRALDDDVCTVMINFTDAEVDVGNPSSSETLGESQGVMVALSSDGSVDGGRFGGRLLGDQAVVLLS
ncbi:MAG: DUF3459 domain-containing protein, partial [Acidimicrobiales bacterium]